MDKINSILLRKIQRLIKPIVYSLMSIVLASSAIYADFDDTGVGARPLGMGGTYIALADDVYTLYYNPAGLGYLRRSEFAAEYERLHVGLTDDSKIYGGFLGYVHPWDIESVTVNTIKISDTEVKTERIENTLRMGALGLGWVNFGLSDVYKEDIYILGWGKRFTPRFAYGLNLKFLQEKYVQDLYTAIDPVFDYGATSSLTALSSDMGILYNLSPSVFLGITGMDLNQPDVGLKNEDKLPLRLKTGVGLKAKQLAMGFDVLKVDEDLRFNCGVENWFIGRLIAMRAGMSLGSRSLRNLSLGFSMDVKKFRIDYGFQFPLTGIEETSGSHRMSFVLRFGLPPKEQIEPGSIEEKLIELEAERKTLQDKLNDAVEMKQKMEQVLIEEAMFRVRTKIKAVEKAVQMQKEKRESSKTTMQTKTHIVKKGETLRSIAKDYYGNPRKWIDIFNVNKDVVGRGGSVKPGKVLIIPGVETRERISTKREKTKKPVPVKKTISKPISPAAAPKPVPVKKAIGPKAVKRPVKTTGGPKTHQVAEGDTLKSIAIKYYNDASRWKDIYMANKDKVTMGRVTPGDIIKIPK